MKLKKCVLPYLSLIFLIFYQPLMSEINGIPFIRNYGPKEYKANSQNWTIVQDNRGIMYFGNSAGVLEYDGVNWRLIKTKDDAVVRMLAKDKKGTIYVGTYGDFGFLQPDSIGLLYYKSLKNKIPEQYRDFADIWNIHTINDRVYFKSYKYLFELYKDTIKVIEPTISEFNESFVFNDSLYLELWQVGLGKLKGDSIELVITKENFNGNYPGISTYLPYSTRQQLIGNPNTGLFLFDGKKVTKFPNAVDDYLIQNQFYMGLLIDSSKYALTTVNGGVVIMNRQGDLIQLVNKESGLINNTVWFIYKDNSNSLWLATDNGISHVEYPSNLSRFDLNNDELGTILQISRFGGKLYVAANNGLFVLKENDSKQTIPFQFNLVDNLNEVVWSMLEFNNDIIVGANHGTFILKSNKAERIRENNSVSLCRSKKFPNRIYIGLIDGLASIYFKNGRWIDEGRIKGIDEYINNRIVETADGDLWLGHYQGIIHVDFPGEFTDSPKVTKYDKTNGLPANKNNYVFSIQQEILFATSKGIHRFDKQNKRIVPDSAYGVTFANGERSVFNMAQDEANRLWLYSNDQIGYLLKNLENQYQWVEKPFLRLREFNTNIIYPDKDGVIWFGGPDGLFKYDHNINKKNDLSLSALIRKVTTFNDSILYGGFHQNDIPAIPQYPYQFNSINFEYALPGFNSEGSNLYQVYMEGFDKNWSQWTSEPKAIYTNIPEGRYVFRVRAKNIYHEISNEARFAFKVLPPWYRSWWAYILYGFFVVGTVFGLIKLRSYKLEAEKKQLENIIHERTDEIQLKNKQLQDQAQKLQEMDEIKSRFFANISHELRTPLTLIKGPAEGILDNSYPGEKEKALKTILLNTNRMLKLINELLELSKLESGSMKLHASLNNITKFVSRVVGSFISLAEQHKIQLQFIKPDQEIKLYFDREKLEKILYNLLSNAFKFTPENGFVTIAINQIQSKNYPNGAVEISVHDSGLGISEEEINQIFDRFVQANDIRNARLEGSGIGLALVKELVELHHGEITVSSHSDEGTEFDLILPLGKDHLNPQEIINAEDSSDKGETELRIDLEDMQSQIKVIQPELNTDVSGEKRVLLIVEDNLEVRDYIKEHFVKQYEIIEAENGKTGFDRAKEFLPDLIISDVMMPEMDGYELSQKLKSNDLTNHIPIILLTAKASDEDKIEGLEKGVEAYMAKPFNVKELGVRVKNLIENRDILRDKFKKDFLLEPTEVQKISMDDEFINKVHDIIEQNMSDAEFDVETLLQDFALGQRQFTRKVVALTGQTPNQFIRIMRLKKAYQLIKQKAGTISEIAFDVGFSNLSYFSKCFRQQFGKLPSEVV